MATTDSEPPPNQEPSPEFFPLLSLPRDVLAIVISEAKDNAPWRLVCAHLKDMVDEAVTTMRCRRRWQEGLFLTSQLIMRLPRLTKVDISDAEGIRDLSPLAACVALQHLNCKGTSVSSLESLAACAALRTLDCGSSPVWDLAPLAACSSLRTLRCFNTGVSSLEPLAKCSLLHTLFCNLCYNLSSLEPLAKCSSLHTLFCLQSGAINSLEPLAKCSLLHTLDCRNTTVSSLEPLASCLSLKKLWCNSTLSRDFDFMKNAKIEKGEYYCYIHFP